MELVSPQHVIDVGCGVGTWLSVFLEHGVDEIVGVDGNYANQEMLQIPKECFIPYDITQSFSLGRKFDLVLSLEVAEHLPEKYADTFVDNLTSLGPVIVFSAAIPFQGGENHVNEQWPEGAFPFSGYFPLGAFLFSRLIIFTTLPQVLPGAIHIQPFQGWGLCRTGFAIPFVTF